MQGQITPEMARAELERRKAARAELERRAAQKQKAPEKSFTEGAGDFVDSLARGGLQAFINPVVGTARAGDKALLASANSSNANPLKAISQIATGAGNYLSDKLGLPNVGDLNPIDLISGATNPTAAKVSEFAASFGLPFLKPLQAMGATGKLAKLGDLAGTGAAYSAADTLGRGDDTNLGTNTLLGAILPVGAHAALSAPLSAAKGLAKGIISGVEKASRREGSGVKTPEQLQKILPDLQGAPIPLQEATNAGYLRSIANESGSIPFSGIVNPAQKAVKHTDEMAKSVFNSIGGHIDPEEANPIIHKAIKAAEERVTKENNDLYTELAKAGKEAGVAGNIDNLKSFSQKILSDYNSKKKENKQHWLDNYSFTRNLLKTFEKGYVPAADKEIENWATKSELPEDLTTRLANKFTDNEGQPIGDLMDLVNTQQAIGKHLGLIRESPARYGNDVEGLVSTLYALSQKDLDRVIEGSQNPNLKGMLQKAKDHFIENVSPYRATDIKKRLTETETADIANALLNPRNAGPTILSHLNPIERDIILSQSLKPAVEAKLENAEFDTTPYKLINKFKDLKKKNPTAFDKLASPQVQKSFESLENLYEATKGLRTTANKPATGVQVKPILYGAGLAGLTGSLGGAAGLSNPASLALAAALGMGNRGFQKLLRDPKLLEAYAAGKVFKGKARENALNELFGGKKSNAIRKTAGALSNPAVLADLVTSSGGKEE